MKRRVLLCDEDTNALTPPDKLDQLYRPMLDYGLRVNLAVIPWVRTELRKEDGQPWEWLGSETTSEARAIPVGHNSELTSYLRANPGFHIAQHGCHHERAEFARHSRLEIGRRLSQGAALLLNAGLGYPIAFVPPDDRLSSTAFDEVTSRYRVLYCRRSLWGSVPLKRWPANLLRRLRHSSSWRAGSASVLDLASDVLTRRMRAPDLVEAVKGVVEETSLAVLVTQWWRYFPLGRADLKAIAALHDVARWLVLEPDIDVVSFADLARVEGFGARKDQVVPASVGHSGAGSVAA